MDIQKLNYGYLKFSMIFGYPKMNYGYPKIELWISKIQHDCWISKNVF